MAKLRRFFEEGLAYFVTTVTKDRKPRFMDTKLCRILLVTLEYHKTVFDYSVYGYCIMPDHLHLILKPDQRFNLSFILKMVKGSFARKVNRLASKDGSFWQAGFYDEAIRSEEQLYRQLEYLHENPVKAGLVAAPNEYVYSSFNQYYGFSNPETEILKIDSLD